MDNIDKCIDTNITCSPYAFRCVHFSKILIPKEIQNSSIGVY